MKSVWAFIGRALYYTAGVVALPIFLNGTKRVKVGIYDPESKQILLSQTWVSHQRWNVVGGGIYKEEDMFVAAIREVKEETGIELTTDDLEFVDTITEKEFMASFTSHVFYAEVPKQEVTKQRFELLDLAWFPITKLPRNRNTQTIQALKIKSR